LFSQILEFLSVLEASEIYLDYFRSIQKVLGQFNEHIEGSGQL